MTTSHEAAPWRLVARREIITRGRSKVYRVTTILVAILAVGFVIGAAVLAQSEDDEPTITVGLLDVGSEVSDALRRDPGGGPTIETIVLDPDDVDDAITDGDVSLVIVADAAGTRGDGSVAYELVWDDEVDPFVAAVVVDSIASAERERRVAELGVDAAMVDELTRPPDVSTRIVDPPDDSEGARSLMAVLTIFVMFFAVQMYGSQIAMVVIEEKAGRIVEILLAIVRPVDLLRGKIVGIGVLAALHVAILATGLAAALAVSGFGDVPVSAYAAMPLLFVVFVFAFAMFGSLFALVGSLVSRQEDAQQAIMPATIPIFIGYALSFPVVAEPDSLLARITALVPITSPFSLPIVTAQGEAPVWLVVTSLGLLAITSYLVVRLAARVYEFTVLRVGTRIPLRDALRLARH